MVDVGYDKHFRVNHKKNEFAKKHNVHINGIESFWSFAKRRLAKFNGVKVNFELLSSLAKKLPAKCGVTKSLDRDNLAFAEVRSLLF